MRRRRLSNTFPVRFAFAAFAALMTSARAPAQSGPSADASQHADATTELRAAIDILKTRHMNRDRLDWPAVERRAFDELKDKQASPIEAYPVIWEIIRALGEKHTILVPASRWQDLMSGDPGPRVSPPLPVARVLGHRTGLLAIDGTWGSQKQDRSYVEAARSGLEQLETDGVCRFVVDLRGNTGGNMWPMVNGVASLLGDPPYGRFLITGGPDLPWDLRTQWMGMANEGVAAAEPRTARPVAPVAILLDKHTVSAGEFTAIAFEGRAHTMFFGEPTAGFVTSNSAVPLPDGARLAVSEGWSTDRIGRGYRVAVVPDRETAPGQPTLDAAIAWLRTQPCRP